MSYRLARPADAAGIGQLHAANWIQEYDGELSAADRSEVVAARVAAWEDRLRAAPSRVAVTYVADGPGFGSAADGAVLGFAHAVADHDARWGSLLGELHVAPSARRAGIGRHLFLTAARWLATHATSEALYLLVRPENIAACRLYTSMGGRLVPSAEAATSTAGLRYYWADLAGLSRWCGR